MGLIGQADEMGEDAGLRSDALDLTKNDELRVECFRDAGEVALRPGYAQQCGIADDAEIPLAAGGELGDDIVGECIGEAIELRIAGFVVESGYCDGDWSGMRPGMGIDVSGNDGGMSRSAAIEAKRILCVCGRWGAEAGDVGPWAGSASRL